MRLINVVESDAWEQFHASQPCTQFLQSWTWGEFRLSQGGTVIRFALENEDGRWQVAIQLEYRRRRFGLGYWFAPRGPVFAVDLPREKRREIMMRLCEEMLQQKVLRERTLFWRMEPVSELNAPEGLVPLRFCRTRALDPSSTIVLDLSPSPEELLAHMHEKTRYNIRLAERKGVRIRIGTTPKDVEVFLNLMDETASRDRFVQHTRDYLTETYAFLHDRGMAQIRLADWEGKILSANMEVLTGDTVTYLYGASSSHNRNVMAPFILHWSAIQEAKHRGFHLYDFWGSNPHSQAMPGYKPSWEGITRFKRGWGGYEVNFVGTWDLPMDTVVYHLIFFRDFFRR